MAGDEGGVKVVGLAEAQRDIERWARELGPAVANDARALADTVTGKTRDRVPVLTGTLAASIETTDEQGDGGFGAGVRYDGTAPYAGWIEFGGSRGRAAVPEGRYLYPTALESADDFARLAEDTAKDTARRFPWSTPTT